MEILAIAAPAALDQEVPPPRSAGPGRARWRRSHPGRRRKCSACRDLSQEEQHGQHRQQATVAPRRCSAWSLRHWDSPGLRRSRRPALPGRSGSPRRGGRPPGSSQSSRSCSSRRSLCGLWPHRLRRSSRWCQQPLPLRLPHNRRASPLGGNGTSIGRIGSPQPQGRIGAFESVGRHVLSWTGCWPDGGLQPCAQGRACWRSVETPAS